MGKIVFITGGARSGKSAFAENLLAGRDDVVYIATAQAFDDEMRARISSHRARRNPAWITVEAPREVARLAGATVAGTKAVLLDCLTVLASNIMFLDEGIDWDTAGPAEAAAAEAKVMDEIAAFISLARQAGGTCIIVSNELGMGVVPPTPLGRHFRDIAGRANQMVAAEADEAYLLVSGIPMKIKG